MTSESFALFLHVAMLSAYHEYGEICVATQHSHYALDDSEPISEHKSKKKNKKSKKSKKSKKRIIPESDNSDDGMIDNMGEILNKDSDDDPENAYRDSFIDQEIEQTIVEDAGTQMSVDREITEITNSQMVIQSDDQQVILQSEDNLAKSNTGQAKSSNKNKKPDKRILQKIITGHTPSEDDTSRVKDILVYDIPVSWTPEKILQQLTLWEKTISMQTKPQRGISVRWFPARWTLKERKQREKFQAMIRKIPESMMIAALWKESHPHSFLSSIKGLKSFKIIQTARGERKLIGYFEKWIDMRNALDNQFAWENVKLSWNRHDPLTQPTRSRGDNTNKNCNRTLGSQSTSKNQQNSKNSKKKPEETKSKKPEKQKKDKSYKASRSKVLAEILDTLRKLI
ncbi:hypothetical protein C1646_787072 [Rhizophagus diaphanus]|nr:hypothetical protein C1646_787072 [Rhizophagus diaphanus] [Rhizophagus sp. MUCL 43196]